MNALVVASNVGGGIARHLALTAQALGHDLEIFNLPDTSSLAHKVGRVRRRVQDAKPEHIVTHGVAAGLAVRLLRRTSAQTSHVEFWHGDPFYARPSRRTAFRALAAVGASPTEQVFVNSSLIAAYGQAGSVTVTLTNAVPPQQLTALTRAPKAAFMGRLSPEKGCADVIAAWPSSMTEWNLTLYGEGAEVLPTLPAGITAAGHTADPLSVMRGVALVVIPSWTEASPYSALEAMSVGTPLVATRTGDLPQLLSSGCGWLVDPRDRPALRRTLTTALASTPEELGQRGRCGHRWLAEHRPFDAWSAQVRAIYHP